MNPDLAAQLHVDSYESVGAWLEAMRVRGFAVPLAMCHGLSLAMKTLDLSFPQAFRLFSNNGKIILSGRALIYDFSARILWEKPGGEIAI